jgi:hypothetical protein
MKRTLGMRYPAVLTAIVAGAFATSAATAIGAATPILAPYRVCIRGAGCVDVPNTIGFGHVKPSKIFLGGDGTGMLCRIHWISWGGRFAIGTGTAADVTGHQDDAHARWSPAVVIASELGTYRGRPAYERVRWSFPDGEVRPESRSCF